MTFAQNEWKEETPDSLASVILEFETLSLKQISSKKPLKNAGVQNVVTYQDEDGTKIAYYTTDRNKWTAVTVPFTTTSIDFKLINIDQVGPSELVVKGRISKYGTGGGTELPIILNE